MLAARRPGGPHPEAVFAQLAHLPGAFWLDGGPGGRGLMGFAPSAEVAPGPGWIERARGLLRPTTPPAGARFAGGLVGAIGYEAGRFVERMPAPAGPRSLPDLVLRRYEGGLHHEPDGSWLAAGTPDFVERALALLDAAGEPPPAAPPSGRLVDEGDPRRFVEGVRRILAHIRAGDCYQVNLARRLVLEGVGDPAAAYLRLRRATPAGFGAWIDLPGGALLSNSPELFFEVEGRQIRSRPIKGTAPLGATEAEDRALVAALEASEKERAELTMLVDLVRKDRGRVCTPGSVRASARELTRLPTLHHAEQTVSGELAGGLDALHALAASFPPGSVTGAPKVAAMGVIGALEPCARGLYTGAIGYLADGGDARLSVAIRVAQIAGDRAEVHVGCGIVADSDPERELDESTLKARAQLAALARGGAAL